MSLDVMGKLLLIIGGIIIVSGLILILLGRIPFLGKLPGDIQIQTDGFTCFFPAATMVIVSIILTILLNVILRLWQR